MHIGACDFGAQKGEFDVRIVHDGSDNGTSLAACPPFPTKSINISKNAGVLDMPGRHGHMEDAPTFPAASRGLATLRG